MLQRILQAMSAGGVHSLRELAQQLDTSEQLLESMIDQLVRMGYLKPLSAPCVEHCHNCPEANRCSIGGSGRAWVLTARGKDGQALDIYMNDCKNLDKRALKG